MSRYLSIICMATILCVWMLTGSRGEVSPAEAHAFITHSGVNLPWINYGWDLGANPWGGEPGGFYANRASLEADFAYMRANHIKLCRVFLFGDFRSGLERDGDGHIVGLDPYVVPDMETLIDVAMTNNIRLIPVLMDCTLADEITHENGTPVGEYPEYITNATFKEQLLTNALQPFLEQFGERETVYAWDIMNEPRLATAVSQSDILAFVEDVAAMIRISAPEARLTVGHYDRYHLAEHGNAVTDLTQIHYYENMSTYWDFNTPALEISDKPTFFGEVQPEQIEYKLNTALSNGYAGILFWSLNGDDGYDFRAVAESYSNWVATIFAGIHKDLVIADIDANSQPTGLSIQISPTYLHGMYRVEASDDPCVGDWLTVTNFRAGADGTATTVTLLGSIEKRMFFRVKADLQSGDP